MEALALKLLSRGDELRIDSGRLVIESRSGKTVPPQWIAEHSPRLCREILSEAGLDAFEYVTYTTGHYGKFKMAGVTLQFVSAVTGRPAYVVFNADLTRQRNTAKGKAGTLLPKGQFRVGKRSHFYKFWLNTGIPLPKRLASFHDYMGKLQGILFDGDTHLDRIDAGSLAPLDLSALQVRTLFLPDSIQTSAGQLPDNCQTRTPDKELPPAHAQQAITPNPTTGAINYGNTVTREHGYTGSPVSYLQTHKPLDEQSVDDWLDEYENA